jgi:hypothetical protein
MVGMGPSAAAHKALAAASRMRGRWITAGPMSTRRKRHSSLRILAAVRDVEPWHAAVHLALGLSLRHEKFWARMGTRRPGRRHRFCTTNAHGRRRGAPLRAANSAAGKRDLESSRFRDRGASSPSRVASRAAAPPRRRLAIGRRGFRTSLSSSAGANRGIRLRSRPTGAASLDTPDSRTSRQSWVTRSLCRVDVQQVEPLGKVVELIRQ